MIELVLNTTWYNPTSDLIALILLMILTMLIEISLIGFYAWRKKYTLSESVLLVMVTILANVLSGMVGFLLNLVI